MLLMRGLIFCLAVVFSMTAAGQESVVLGVATNMATGQPLDQVRVELVAGGAAHSATTGPDGRFRFEGVTPGVYQAIVQRKDFERRQWQVRIPGGTFHLDATLAPWARVSGVVTLGAGQPAAGVPVELRRRGGRPRFTAVTGSDGSYLLERVPAGRYLLSAGGRGAELRKMKGYRPPKAGQTEAGMGWAPVFYPNGRTASEAQTLTIRPAQELAGYDLRMEAVEVHSVSGVVEDERGQPAAGATLELFAADVWFGAEYETRADEQGRFRIDGVRAGDWFLRGSTQTGGVTRKGKLATNVSRTDLHDLRVELGLPFSLRGMVEREEPRDSDGQRKVSAVALNSLDGGAKGELTFHGQDGRIEIRNVYPGRYEIEPLGFLAGWYLEAVYLGDQDVLGKPVELRPGVPEFRVVYRDRAGAVRGSIERERPAYVYLLPVEEALWTGQFLRVARAGNDGNFDLHSLRPGDYFAFAFEEQQNPDDFSVPELVRPLATQGERVTVRRGLTSEVTLKALPSTAW